MNLFRVAVRRALTAAVLTAATVLSGLPVVERLPNIGHIREPLMVGLYLTIHAFVLRFLQVLGEALARGEEMVVKPAQAAQRTAAELKISP